MFQFRDPSAPVAVYYSPGRDFAHVGLRLISDGLDRLKYSVEHGSKNVRDYMQKHKISEQELKDALEAFVASIEEEIKNPAEGMLTTNSFSRCRYEVRYLVYSSIAPLFIAAAIKGKKDVLNRADAVEYYGEEFHKKITKLTLRWEINSPTLIDSVKTILQNTGKIFYFYLTSSINWARRNLS